MIYACLWLNGAIQSFPYQNRCRPIWIILSTENEFASSIAKKKERNDLLVLNALIENRRSSEIIDAHYLITIQFI